MQFSVSREVEQMLLSYQELTFKWNKYINLISSSTVKNFWSRHILDSLQLMSYIDEPKCELLDIGSGAGLPGIVLAIAGIKDVSLVESDFKKTLFLLQAAKISSNKITVINSRIEDLNLGCDIVTSRAFAKIAVLLGCASVRKKYLLLKGENWLQDVEDAQKFWSFSLQVYDSATSKKGKILEITNVVKLRDKNISDS